MNFLNMSDAEISRYRGLIPRQATRREKFDIWYRHMRPDTVLPCLFVKSDSFLEDRHILRCYGDPEPPAPTIFEEVWRWWKRGCTPKPKRGIRFRIRG